MAKAKTKGVGSGAEKRGARAERVDRGATRGAIDPGAARTALARATPRLRALAAAAIKRSNVDPGAAAHVVVVLAQRAAAPALRARLASLPRGEFDVAQVERLLEGGLALFAAHAAVQTTNAVRTNARLPAALVSEATTVRARMLRLLDYHFEHDAVYGPELSAIHAGGGFLDMAHDLERVADVYDAEPDVVSADAKYVDGDAALARQLAGKILAELDSADPSSRAARDLEARAFTAAHADYDDVAATVNWLERKAAGAVRVPTLAQAARPGLGATVRRAFRKKKKAAKAGAAST